MTKQELIKDIKQTFDGAGLISVNQVAKYRGVHPNAATRFLKGLDYTQSNSGNRKYYFVGDIAEQILRDKVCS